MKRLLALLLLGVSPPALSYDGDGTFVDHGVLTAHDRYVLDLGPVTLVNKWRREYRLSRLPQEVFVVGLKPPGMEKRPNAKIRLLLTNEKGEEVIDTSAHLADWVWSNDGTDQFVYRRGISKEVPSQGTATTFEREGVRPDGGWGTYFSPRRKGLYVLTIEVVEAAPAYKDFNFKLEVVGGGWK